MGEIVAAISEAQVVQALWQYGKGLKHLFTSQIGTKAVMNASTKRQVRARVSSGCIQVRRTGELARVAIGGTEMHHHAGAGRQGTTAQGGGPGHDPE